MIGVTVPPRRNAFKRSPSCLSELRQSNVTPHPPNLTEIKQYGVTENVRYRMNRGLGIVEFRSRCGHRQAVREAGRRTCLGRPVTRAQRRANGALGYAEVTAAIAPRRHMPRYGRSARRFGHSAARCICRPVTGVADRSNADD